MDILRAINREPEATAALLNGLETCRGADARYDAHLDNLLPLVRDADERGARALADNLALAVQAAALLSTGSPAAAPFVAARLAPIGPRSFGAADLAGGEGVLLERLLGDPS